MPIIVKNNKKYGGTYSNATDVNYDNSVSKLNAGTTQEALDELADGLKKTSPVNNLLSTSTTLPLSANQGRVLDEKISTINERFATSTNSIEIKSQSTFPNARIRARINPSGNPMLESYTFDSNGTMNNYLALIFDGTNFTIQGIKNGGTTVTKTIT